MLRETSNKVILRSLVNYTYTKKGEISEIKQIKWNKLMHQMNAKTKKSGSKLGEKTYLKLQNDGEKYDCLERSYTKTLTSVKVTPRGRGANGLLVDSYRSSSAFSGHNIIKTQAPGCAKSLSFNASMEEYRRGSTLNINCAVRCAHVSKTLRERDVSKDDLVIPDNSCNEHNQTRRITKISTLSP